MKEKFIVEILVNELSKNNYIVSTEIANFHRSADVAAIDREGNVIVVECKSTSISRAIEQAKTHKLSANKVYICTMSKNSHYSTIRKIKEEGLGLIYIMPDNTLKIIIDCVINDSVWLPAYNNIKERIINKYENGPSYIPL